MEATSAMERALIHVAREKAVKFVSKEFEKSNNYKISIYIKH